MIVWLAVDSPGVEKLALPLLSSVAVPILVPPSSNWTVPVGVAVLGDTALTTTENVTDCP